MVLSHQTRVRIPVALLSCLRERTFLGGQRRGNLFNSGKEASASEAGKRLGNKESLDMEVHFSPKIYSFLRAKKKEGGES